MSVGSPGKQKLTMTDGSPVVASNSSSIQPLLRSRKIRAQAGPFVLKDTLGQQQVLLERLRTEEPEQAKEIMRTGRQLFALATIGDVKGLMQMVTGLGPDGWILHWWLVKSFQGACTHGHISTVKYFVVQGFDVHCEGARYILHSVIEKYPHGQSPLPMVQLLLQLGLDMDQPRKPDYFTPLHIACLRKAQLLVSFLIKAGACVNAVAKVFFWGGSGNSRRLFKNRWRVCTSYSLYRTICCRSTVWSKALI